MLTVLAYIPETGRLRMPGQPDRVWFASANFSANVQILEGRLALSHGQTAIIADLGHDYQWRPDRRNGHGTEGFLYCSRAKHEGGCWIFIQWETE